MTYLLAHEWTDTWPRWLYRLATHVDTVLMALWIPLLPVLMALTALVVWWRRLTRVMRPR